jgi:hypothetical protein
MHKLPYPALLGHNQLSHIKGRETLFAYGPFPASPKLMAIGYQTRVDNLGFLYTTEGTNHKGYSFTR